MSIYLLFNNNFELKIRNISDKERKIVMVKCLTHLGYGQVILVKRNRFIFIRAQILKITNLKNFSP